MGRLFALANTIGDSARRKFLSLHTRLLIAIWQATPIPRVEAASTSRRSDEFPFPSLDMVLEATGRNVLIRRDPVVRSESGLLLPEEATYRSCMATVISVGSHVREVQVGDRVHYNPMGLLDFMFGDDPDLAVCTEMGINAVIGR